MTHKMKTIKKIHRHKRHRGGSDYEDIEMGRASPVQYMDKIPPRPERIREHELDFIRRSMNPLPRTDVVNIFAGPTPEQRAKQETRNMLDEDPQFQDPFHREELRIFKRGGKRYRKKRVTKHLRKRRGGDKGVTKRIELERDEDFIPMEQDEHMDNEHMDNEQDDIIAHIHSIMRETIAHMEVLDSRLDELEQLSEEEREPYNEEALYLKTELRRLINLVKDYEERLDELIGEHNESHGGKQRRRRTLTKRRHR